MTIGEKIKSIRLRRKLTQQELAETMNMDSGNFRKYESDKRQERPETIESFAKALNIAPEALSAANMDAIKAMHSLFLMFELYGGRFVNNDGDISVTFDALEPFLIEWNQKYQSMEPDSLEYLEWLDRYPQSSELPQKYIDSIRNLDDYSDKLDSQNEMP